MDCHPDLDKLFDNFGLSGEAVNGQLTQVCARKRLTSAATDQRRDFTHFPPVRLDRLRRACVARSTKDRHATFENGLHERRARRGSVGNVLWRAEDYVDHRKAVGNQLASAAQVLHGVAWKVCNDQKVNVAAGMGALLGVGAEQHNAVRSKGACQALDGSPKEGWRLARRHISREARRP